MDRPRKLILVVVSILAFSPLMFSSTTYYISDAGGSASCGADGTQSTQAYNFSSYSAGDTLKLCGTIVHDLVVQQNSISIIFESNASLQIPVCSNGCIQLNGYNNGLIDGGTPCGPSTSCSTNFGDYGLGATGTGYILQTTVGTPAATITSITCSAGVATVSGPAAFGYSMPNQPQVTISGNSVASYNTTVAVASDNDSNKTFTFAATCNGTGTGGKVGVLCPSGSYCSSRLGTNMIDTQNSGGSGWEIRNLLIGPFFLRTSVTDTTETGGEFNSIYMQGCNGCSWKIHDLTEAEAGNTYIPVSSGDNGFQFYDNALRGMTVGLAIAGSTSSNNLSGAQIHDNLWVDVGIGDTPGCSNHTSNIHSWAINGSVATGENFYNNWVTGNNGGCLTGSMFFEGTHKTTNIYNNVFTPTYTQNNNGIIGFNGPGPFLIANNTIIGALASDLCFEVGSPSGSPTLTFENNVVSGCDTQLVWKNSPGRTQNYNLYGCDSTTTNCGSGWTSSSTLLCNYSSSCAYYDLSQMQSDLSIDANSSWNYTAGSTGLSTSTGAPSSESPVIGKGTDLSSLCVGNITSLCSDTSAGDTRIPTTRSSPWTIGAYSTASNAPAPPTNLNASVQ